MGELNFQTGRKEYTVNGGVQITFEPADIKFANAIIAAFGNCADISRNANIADLATIEEACAATIKLDKDIRAEINRAFGYDVCSLVFPDLSVIAVADGLPVWANFLMAIVDEIDTHSGNVFVGQAKTKERVQKYLDKYSAKRDKYRRA